VTKKLIIYAYLQIGVIQAAAGFYTWLVVLNDYGFPPHVLIGLGRANYFGRQPIMCVLGVAVQSIESAPRPFSKLAMVGLVA